MRHPVLHKPASLLAIPLIAALFAVSGCQFPDGTGERKTGGGGGGTPPTQDIRVAGIWDGITVGAASVRMTALVQGGRFMMVGDDLIYDGTYPPTNNSNINVTADVYGVNNARSTSVNITGGIDRLSIGFAQPVGVNLGMEEAVWNRGSSLSRLTDNWTARFEGSDFLTLTINNQGAFNSQDADGCLYEGSFSIIDTTINLYTVAFSITGAGSCTALQGKIYTGMASLFPNNNTLFLLAVNGTQSIFYIFERN